MTLRRSHPPARARCAYASALVFSLLLGACSGAPRAPRTGAADTAVARTGVEMSAVDSSAVVPVANTPLRSTTFTRVPVGNPRSLRALVDSLGESQWLQVLKLNRVDFAHVRDRDSLILPDVFGDSLDLSPFPRTLVAVRDTAKLVLVSLRLQAFAAYDSGQLARWGPTSSGRKAKPTPTGVYHATWKDRDRISTIDDEWLMFWCVNIENREGVTLHQYDLPGRPASHSCVRLLETDARWVYGWAEQWKLSADGQLAATGTPVVVFGEWAWGQRAPWKRLPEDPGEGSLTPAEVEEALRMLREGDRPRFGVTP